MGQATYIVFVIAACDLLNVNLFHSQNLELMIEVALVAFMAWILIGAFLVYQGQSMMKKWYRMEAEAHDPKSLDKLYRQYEKIYTKFKSTG